MLGRIVTWRDGRSYGWIGSAALRTRGIFLHRDQIVSGEPAEGRRVRFELVDRGRGPRAEQASILEEDEPDPPGEASEPVYRVPAIEAYLARREGRG